MTAMIYPALVELPYVLGAGGPSGEDTSDQYPESLVRYFLDAFTKKGDKVLDPFLGLGTTAFVAEEMGRIPYGKEADRKRFEWAAGQLEHWNNIHYGDSAQIALGDFPKMDFCMTSPPYMPMHHQWNPLYGGDPEYAGYDHYLERLEFIFQQVRGVMKKKSYLVVHADNLQTPRRRYTPLVRDISLAVSKSFQPEAEIIVKWSKGAPEDYPHTHCLLFKAV